MSRGQVQLRTVGWPACEPTVSLAHLCWLAYRMAHAICIASSSSSSSSSSSMLHDP